ncbi:MAG: PorT family protein [Lentimicrobium sp.]|nr:PorT family protein [Lentimicrobium sp.]
MIKKLFLIFLIIALSSTIYSQITYERGYYLNKEGRRIEGLIKNTDWQSNPSEFLFKSSDSAQPVKLTIDSVTEFGVIGQSRYLNKKVRIDRSSDLISELSTIREPLFNEEQLFLKMLIGGKHSLYVYIDGNLRRFFIESDNTEIKQLIYKNYLSGDRIIGINNDFRKQLWLHLRCDAITIAEIENTAYESKSLIRIFEKFNVCDNAVFVRYNNKSGYDFFNLTLRPGLNISTLSIGNSNILNKEIKFGTRPGFQLGIETELILPFNKNKWAIIAEPGFLYYEGEGSSQSANAEINYYSLELPVGLRHYFFFGEDSKVFINGSAVFNYAFNSDIKYNTYQGLEINTNLSAAFGLGYKFKNRFSMEFRVGFLRNLLVNYHYWYTDYNSYSFIFGYTIF